MIDLKETLHFKNLERRITVIRCLNPGGIDTHEQVGTAQCGKEMCQCLVIYDLAIHGHGLIACGRTIER
jgi:hypothetical protein